MDLLTFEKFLDQPDEVDFYAEFDAEDPESEDPELDSMENEQFSTHLD